MIILYCFLGIIAGTITGLTPGLHSNNVVAFLSTIPLFGIESGTFILSMCITQSFVDFIPSIFLGVPDTDTFEGVLPGHILLLKGRAFEAVALTVFGGLVAIVFSIIFLPIVITFLSINRNNFSWAIVIVLAVASIILIASEKSNKKRLLSSFVLICAANQGLLFTGQIFPLITGYFGISTLLYSQNNNKPIIQKQEQKILIKKAYFLEGIVGLLGGALVSIFPGVGNNVAAAIIRIFRKKIPPRRYLVLLGSINTSNFFFSLPVLFVLGDARNGAMIFMKDNFIPTIGHFLSSIDIMLISGGFGAIITLVLAKKFSTQIQSMDTRIIKWGVIVLMVLLVFLVNGFIGLATLIFSTALGLFVTATKIKRTNCLGSLIIPSLFFYLFILI